MRAYLVVAVATMACGCKRDRSHAPEPTPVASEKPAADAANAEVVHEDPSPTGEARMFSAVVSDVDADGRPELIAAGFRDEANGRRSAITVYTERERAWTPRAVAPWGAPGSTVRNVGVADLDLDGREEIVGYGRVGDDGDAKARLAVYALREGEPVLIAHTEWRTGAYTHGYGLDLGDLDGDGTPEIVTGGFQGDDAGERGFVRVWTLNDGTLVSRAELVLDGEGTSTMRINGLALGDVDGDGRREIVVAGRRSPPRAEGVRGRRDLRRETGDVSVLGLTGDTLVVRARQVWQKGSTTRLRSVAVADLDGDRVAEIVAGGQFDKAGKPCLGLFAMSAGALVLRHDATAADAGAGEIKSVVIDGEGPDARVITTGPRGPRKDRQGELGAWRLREGKLVREVELVSQHGDETRVRAAVVVEGARGPTVLTVGHALKHQAVIGQILSWKLP